MLLATFRLDPGSVALEQTLDVLSDVEFEAERIATHSPTRTMPCLWASHTDFEAVDEALAQDPSVETIIERQEFSTEKYYHVEWADEVNHRIATYLEKEAALLRARATGDGWRVRIRFVHREQFDTFRDTLQEMDCSFRLLDLEQPKAPRQSFGALTPDQREALVAALELGYYDIPREATIEDVADDLDKSHQAVSELLRRGTRKLFDEMLTTDENDTGAHS